MGSLLVDPFKISLAVVAALLTIVGFSINDTIVIFDRIREVRGKSPELTEEMINLSVNQTLSRTILTSGTVFIASIILYVVGGPGIHAVRLHDGRRHDRRHVQLGLHCRSDLAVAEASGDVRQEGGIGDRLAELVNAAGQRLIAGPTGKLCAVVTKPRVAPATSC